MDVVQVTTDDADHSTTPIAAVRCRDSMKERYRDIRDEGLQAFDSPSWSSGQDLAYSTQG